MFWKLQVKCEIILQGRKLDFKHLFYNNLADELSVTKAFPQNWPFKVVVLVTVCAKCRWSWPTKWDVSPPVMLSFPVWMSGFVNYLRQGMCDQTGNCIKKKQPYLPKSMFTSLANKVVLSTLCHSGGIKLTTLVVTGTNYLYVNSTIIRSRPWQPSKNPNAITNSKPQCLFELLKCNQLLTLSND